jgi:hypothetical protein
MIGRIRRFLCIGFFPRIRLYDASSYFSEKTCDAYLLTLCRGNGAGLEDGITGEELKFVVKVNIGGA